MADWDKPVLTDNYTDFLVFLKARDLDAATLFLNVPTNPQEGFIRFLRAQLLFQEYLSGVWTTRLLSIAGGGTGAATPADARANLGLGALALQNPGAVNITGGSISGINFNAAVIAAGNLNIARLPVGGDWALTALLSLSGHAFHAKALGAAYRVGAGTTLTDTDFLYECSGGTIDLPNATTITGRIYIIKRSGSTVTLDPFGGQTISISGVDVASYAGLGSNQSIILQSNGIGWIAITMGGTVFRDNQFPTVTMGAGNAIENQALPDTVNEVEKAVIFFLTGLQRITGTSGEKLTPVTIHFSTSGGVEVISGPATHVRLLGGDTNSPAQDYKFIIQEWE